MRTLIEATVKALALLGVLFIMDMADGIDNFDFAAVFGMLVLIYFEVYGGRRNGKDDHRRSRHHGR